MAALIIDKGPLKLTIEGIPFFEVRTYLGVFVGAFSDEKAAWGVERQVHISIEIEKILEETRDAEKEAWYRATMKLPGGATILRYAALVSGGWSKTFDDMDKLSAELADEPSDELTRSPGI